MLPTYVAQAGTFGPFLQSIPCIAMTYGMYTYLKDVYFTKLQIIYSPTYGKVYYRRDEAERVGDYYLDHAMKDSRFIDDLYQEWHLDLDGFEKDGQTLRTSAHSDKELKVYYDHFINLWARSMFVEVYDEDYEERITKHAREMNCSISHDEILLATQPDYISIPLQFERELIDILRSGGDSELLVKRYYFLDAGYLTAPVIDLGKRIQELKEEGLEQAYERISTQIKSVKQNQERRQTLFTERNFPQELIALFSFFQATVMWRDVRKKMQQIGGYYLSRVLEDLIPVPKELIPYSIVQDYFNRDCLDSGYQNVLEKRKECSYFAVDYHGTIEWIYEKSQIETKQKELDEEDVATKEIIGKSAYKGLVRGKVRIIKSIQDFEKMKKGDILVSPMTRPEYVPIMKLALAIVTDEGGVTSHAAIVSRELGIPCVIGTRNATRILKDNDEVEVDAGSGIVRITNKINLKRHRKIGNQ